MFGSSLLPFVVTGPTDTETIDYYGQQRLVEQLMEMNHQLLAVLLFVSGICIVLVGLLILALRQIPKGTAGLIERKEKPEVLRVPELAE